MNFVQDVFIKVLTSIHRCHFTAAVLWRLLSTSLTMAVEFTICKQGIRAVTNVIIPTNRSKQRDEPIRIPSNYLLLVQTAGKIRAYKVRLVRLALVLHLIG